MVPLNLRDPLCVTERNVDTPIWPLAVLKSLTWCLYYDESQEKGLLLDTLHTQLLESINQDFVDWLENQIIVPRDYNRPAMPTRTGQSAYVVFQRPLEPWSEDAIPEWLGCGEYCSDLTK
jgi:hypothetical protein